MAKKGGKKKGGKKKGQKGKGFMDVMKKIGGFLKDTKILSTVGSMIPHPGVQAAARLAGSVGLGRKGKKKKGQKGRGANMVLHGVRSTTRPAIVPIVKL